MTLQIRLAVDREADSIAGILAEAFQEFKPAYTPEAYSATTPSGDQISARFREGPIWVAVDGEELIGTISAVPRDGEVYIRSLAVLSSARGKGTAKALLEAAEAYAAETGFSRLTLCTTPFLLHAIRLYEQSGYRHTGEGLDDLFGTPLICMSKPLDSPVQN
ncbi:GNAT family N-acetyltransferase [bacterium]|nr:MAG: GNAT family N-acetyltransferase [bacterium]